MLIGYARTSTEDQIAGFEAQKADLLAAGCERVFEEQVSSVAERVQLDAMLAFVRRGDCIVITKIDRLARNVVQLLTIANDLNIKGVGLKVLGSDIDTSTANGRLILSLLGTIAQHEREQMLERQKIGIAKAKAEGRYKGRIPTARRQADDVRKLAAEGMTRVDIAAQLSISRQSVWRILSDGETVAAH